MTDTSSSGNAPSPVVCPLAKLGQLSSSTNRLPLPYVTTTGTSLSSPLPPPPLLHNQRYKTDFSKSFDCKSSPSSDRDRRSSDFLCDGVIVGYSSPAYRYQETSFSQSPVHTNFYRKEKQVSNENTIFQTSLGYQSSGRTSPCLDQGYHTLVSPSPPGWLMTSVGKYKKTQVKYCHIDRLPDDIMLQIFSWLSTNELCSISRVCRRWYNLVWNQSLWKTITLQGERTCGDRAVKSILRRLCGKDEKDACLSVKQLFVYDGAKITDTGLSAMAKRCPELTHVQLQNCPTLSDSSISDLVSRCPRIQHLDVTGCPLVSCVSVIPRSDLQPKLLLQHLDLTDCISVQDSSLRIILRNCPLLTYLYLRRCSSITDNGIKFLPSFCPSMRELSVSDCHLITDFALYELAKLGSNLRYLSVAKCDQISDAGLKMIAKRCYKLRYLNVRGCEAVSDDALSAVARSCPRLRALDIGKCDISDIGLKVLAESCPNLKKLSVRSCDLVTDRGIQYVCYYCRGLQQLNIQDCQITVEGYKAVKRFCKRCIIEHTNPGFF